jgi:lysophospholipase L1-like esterase
VKKLLTAFCLLLPLAAQASPNLATAPIDRLGLPWWKARFALTLAQAKADPNAKIIWLGDSITYYWQRHGGHGYDDIAPIWNRDYAPYQALNFGFIGDTTSSLIWRLDHGQVSGLHPKLAIILIGANNLGRVHWDAAMTIPGIEAVVTNTQHHLPGAHILLLGVLPSIRSRWVDTQTTLINSALAKHYAHNPTVTFVNLAPDLLINGHANPALYVDPRLTPPEPALHPNATGMSRIAATLEPLVRVYAQ